MTNQALDALPLWAFFPITCLIIWAALEAGFRLGRWRHARAADEKDSSVGVIVGSVLGLLAFMLAFTFGAAATRFEERRQVVLEEANAIGTADLRTRLLPEKEGKDIAVLLGQYVKVRLEAAKDGSNPKQVEEAIEKSTQLQAQMWDKAMIAAKDHPTVMTALLVQSLNEVFDVHSKRVLIGVRSRIPFILWIVLLAIALVAMASTGYQGALSGARRSPATAGLVIAFAGVLTLIADLDRPGAGLLRTSQAALVDAQKSLRFP